jgi:hypothetical protein
MLLFNSIATLSTTENAAYGLGVAVAHQSEKNKKQLTMQPYEFIFHSNKLHSYMLINKHCAVLSVSNRFYLLVK